jgi:hypothetical protein
MGRGYISIYSGSFPLTHRNSPRSAGASSISQFLRLWGISLYARGRNRAESHVATTLVAKPCPHRTDLTLKNDTCSRLTFFLIQTSFLHKPFQKSAPKESHKRGRIKRQHHIYRPCWSITGQKRPGLLHTPARWAWPLSWP